MLHQGIRGYAWAVRIFWQSKEEVKGSRHIVGYQKGFVDIKKEVIC